MNRLWFRLILVLAPALLLGACATAQQAANVVPTRQATVAVTLTQGQPTPTRQPTATATPTATRAPTATATPPPPTMTPIPAATATPAHSRPPQPTAPAVATAAFHYVFPVHSEGKITYGKYHHDYPAADIFCSIGSEFVAPTDGVVDFVSREDSWTPAINDGATRGGLSVAIIGDDGVRYYGSHLSQVAEEIAPGVRVQAGQLLGLTGKSGDARYTDAHLHFGISHPTTPEDWQVRRGEVTPYNYLRAWQRGENVTPKIP